MIALLEEQIGIQMAEEARQMRKPDYGGEAYDEPVGGYRVKGSNRSYYAECIKLAREGVDPALIAERYGITAWAVSHHLQTARQKGDL